MGFDAGQAVDALDYDFRPYVEDAYGTIPEPTDTQVEGLFAALREVAVASGADLNAGPDAILIGLANLPEEEVKAHSDAMLEALASFCQGTPSREEIEALPVRPRQMFMGWLIGQLAGPGKAGATSASPALANGAGPHI